MKRNRSHWAGGDQGLDFVEVVPMAGGEVVEADDGLVEPEERIEQVRADETGHAGDEPGARGVPEGGLGLVVSRHGLGRRRRSGVDWRCRNAAA